MVSSRKQLQPTVRIELPETSFWATILTKAIGSHKASNTFEKGHFADDSDTALKRLLNIVLQTSKASSCHKNRAFRSTQAANSSCSEEAAGWTGRRPNRTQSFSSLPNPCARTSKVSFWSLARWPLPGRTGFHCSSYPRLAGPTRWCSANSPRPNFPLPCSSCYSPRRCNWDNASSVTTLAAGRDQWTLFYTGR